MQEEMILLFTLTLTLTLAGNDKPALLCRFSANVFSKIFLAGEAIFPHYSLLTTANGTPVLPLDIFSQRSQNAAPAKNCEKHQWRHLHLRQIGYQYYPVCYLFVSTSVNLFCTITYMFYYIKLLPIARSYLRIQCMTLSSRSKDIKTNHIQTKQTWRWRTTEQLSLVWLK